MCFVFVYNNAYSQTKLDDKLLRLEKIYSEKQNAIYAEINPFKLKKLTKLGISVSNFDFTTLEDRKQINLFFQAQKSKNGLTNGAVFLNSVGVLLVGVGVYATALNANGGVIAMGIFPLVLGLGINGVSVPVHLAATKKRKHFFELQRRLINTKHF